MFEYHSSRLNELNREKIIISYLIPADIIYIYIYIITVWIDGLRTRTHKRVARAELYLHNNM